MGRDDDPINKPDDSIASPTSEPPSIVDLPIDIDDLLPILANERTRYLLYLLTERGGTLRLEEITQYFDDEEIAAEFHHNQLPRLVDYQIANYNQETGAITLTPIGDELKPFIETIRSWDDDSVDEFLLEATRFPPDNQTDN